MLNFDNVVIDILTEEPINTASVQQPSAAGTTNTSSPLQKPDWFKDVLDLHSKLFETDIPDDAKLRSIYAIATKRPSKNDVLPIIKYIRILDVLTTIYGTLPDRPKSLEQFYEQTKEAPIGTEIYNKFKNLTSETKNTWDISNSLVRTAYNLALADADKSAAVALMTYKNLPVLETVKKIVAKRVSVADRILNLKSPTQPFTNLITDIFNNPEDYKAGRKKVSGDFFNIVDDLYVQNLFTVGLAAKEFYKSELARLQADEEEGIEQAPEQEQVNAGLNLFDTYYDSILVSEIGAMALPTVAQNIGRNIRGIGQAVAQGAKQGVKMLRRGERLAKDPKYKQRYENLRKKINVDRAAYEAFLNGKPITYGSGKTTGTYNIAYISQLDTPEAQNLINALKGIAEYIRKGVGAGQVVKGVTSLGAGIGPVG